MQEYLSLKALSSGMCSEILNSSPLHAKFRQDNRIDEPTSASELGTAFHDAFLEGIDRIVALDFPDWRTKAAKEARVEARATGRIPMLSHKVSHVATMVAACKEYVANSEIAGAFDDGDPELTIVWLDSDLLCKIRPDFLTRDHRLMIHLKSTQGSAEPTSWIRNQLVPMGYDCAAEFYRRGHAAVSRDSPLQVFLVAEQNPPHGCSLVSLDPAMLEIANQKVERAVGIWRECLRTNRYPCYPTRICYAEPKPWEVAEAEREQFDPMLGEQA